MGIVIRSSSLVRPDRAAVALRADTPGLMPAFGYNGSPRPGEVLFPRYVPGVGTRMVRTPVEYLPPGWQSIGIRVPMRLATCEEANCIFLRNGWTEVLPGDGNRVPVAGDVSGDQAAATWGSASSVIHHPPGTPCQRIHKLPSGIPPLYHVNGRPTLWNEFEDSIGSGVHRMQRLIAEGTS